MKKLYILLLFVPSWVHAQIVTIPDANFKNKLLAASSDNQIARDVNEQWFKIDANEDGEIQLIEALQVYGLFVDNDFSLETEKISSLEGLSSFINLKQFSCNGNLLSSFNVQSLANLEFLSCGNNQFTSLNVQGLPLLVELNCGLNQLTTLNLSNLPSLKNLSCSLNQLTNLDLTSLPNLESLWCNLNHLTSLNIQGLSNLIFINCDSNQLSALNVQGLTGLEGLYAENNQLIVLDLSPAVGLTEILLNNNLLTELNVNGLNSVTVFRCNNNLFTTLNIESLTQIQEFRCSENSLLETIFIKNGRDEFIWAVNCPNLAYICADESQIQSILLLGSAGNPDDYVLNSYCTFVPGGNYNTISGTVKFDATTNGCDATDLTKTNIRIDISNGTNQGATFTNSAGNYTFFTHGGNFTLTPNIENPDWFLFSPPTATIPFTDGTNAIVNQDFCITPNGFHPDVEITIAPIFPARPGFDAVYQIAFKNIGNQNLSQNNGISFMFNQNLMHFISATENPSTIGNGNLSWNYANLAPFESRSIYVTLNINTSTADNPVNIGNVLLFSASILPLTNDESAANNTFSFNQEVVGSYNSNDITAVQGSEAPISMVGEYLHYVINFRNTGNATVENVVVKMECNPLHFNMTSLQMVDASHDFYARMNGNVMELIFENIQLDSGGHGNILLKLKSSTALAENLVLNSANIFFDYGAAINTSEEQTVFADLSKDDFTKNTSIQVYPNPVQSEITIKAESTINSIQLYDVQGRIVFSKSSTQNSVTVDLSSYGAGVYFVTIITSEGRKTRKIIKN